MQEQFVEPQITEYLFQKAVRDSIPICGTFELSPICNFNCKMCYVRQTKEYMEAEGKSLKSKEFWLDLARQAKEQGMLYLLLTGGEPLLYPDFWELYEELSNMGFVISINSNGSLVDEAAVERFKVHPPSRMNITLYGTDDDTYERICRIKKGYTRAIRGIRLLKETGISVKLNCSLTPDNASDLEEVLGFAEKENMIVEVATYMFPPVRRDETLIGQNRRFTPEEMAGYNLQTLRYQRGVSCEQNFAQAMVQEICKIPSCLSSTCQKTEGEKIRCRAGRGIFWTTWEGNITPCGMLPHPAISLEGRTFANAWKQLTVETSQIRTAPECKDCKNKEICHVCAGMTYAETGNFKVRPEYLCHYVNALKEQAKRACEKEEIA